MKGILLNLIQVFSSAAAGPQDDPGGSLANIQWLNIQKHYLFLNSDEVYFDVEYVKILEGNVECRVNWKNLEFFHYPYVGLNIEIPGRSNKHYFSLILKEERTSELLLGEFISHLTRQSGKRSLP